MGVLRDHHYYDTDMMERLDGVAPIYDCPERLGYSLGNYQGPACPYGAHVARVRGRASLGVEAEVGTRASWRVTRIDHGGP
ncbi:hypothetical protein E6C27_scaffold75G001270 [Cucumis melo var. makuwa]|uniref:Uncharacterized protein n=1 Tax=Cucumis melo var. makuwa TaxID=1194695 RepID=A0A5A7TNQ0_CUCMM|nr:hypothetical protein E6C27_scaffold75G001270 [Cucumis melo var. makuwa]